MAEDKLKTFPKNQQIYKTFHSDFGHLNFMQKLRKMYYIDFLKKRQKTLLGHSGPNLDKNSIQFLDSSPFQENYTKLCLIQNAQKWVCIWGSEIKQE